MTKKDFELIARVIKRLNFDIPSLCTSEKDKVAELLACEIAKMYPRFDIERFLKACGKESIWQEVKLKACWCGSQMVHTHE